MIDQNLKSMAEMFLQSSTEKDCACVMCSLAREICEGKYKSPEEIELEKYSKELGVVGIDTTSLISSHRYLRNESIEFNKNKQDAIRKAEETAAENFKKYAEENNILTIEKLKSMTIEQLVELLL